MASVTDRGLQDREPFAGHAPATDRPLGSHGGTGGLIVAPRATRWIASVFSTLFGADVLQIAYRKAEDA